MAIWQFQTFILPRSAVTDFFNTTAVLSEELLTEVDWWAQTQPPADYEERINHIASRYKSWSKDIIMWGCEEGDRIHVLLEEKEGRRVEEISVRIDLRKFSREFVAGVIHLASDFDCVLWVEPSSIVDPSMSSLCDAILKSRAAAFMRDPEGYLRSLLREE